MHPHDRPDGAGAPRDFYEDLSARTLHPHTVRGIAYRNLTVARQVPGRGARVLEVGPGEGWLSRILAERGHRVTAVDVARGWLRRLPPETVRGRVAGEMPRLPFATGSFDAVVAAEVIEHIPDIDGAVAEAARVLAPGGRLVVTVPYRETLTYAVCPECRARFEVNGHVHTFDEDRLHGILSGAGLRPVHRFVGPTRFSREILRRLPVEPLLGFLAALDRLSYRSQRVSDTWLLMTAIRP